MKTQLLLPHRFKLIGLLLLIPGIVLGIAILFYFEFSFLDSRVLTFFYKGFSHFEWVAIRENNLTDELAALLIIIGGLFMAFSREKQEDEYVARLRLESLMWSTLITYILMALCFIFIYGDYFFQIMMINPFILLLIFIIRFNVVLYRSKRKKQYEE